MTCQVDGPARSSRSRSRRSAGDYDTSDYTSPGSDRLRKERGLLAGDLGVGETEREGASSDLASRGGADVAVPSQDGQASHR
jgi:hypothetical protein